MVHYVVTWTIDIFGDQIECGDPSPYNAAKTAQHMLQKWSCDWQYDVKDVDTGRSVLIDMDKDLDEELDDLQYMMKKEYRERFIKLNEEDRKIIKDFEELIKNSQHNINEYSAKIRKRTLEIAGLDAQLRKLEQ
jgi:hypothetical protein